MKCPACGSAELVHGCRDLLFSYRGRTIAIPAIHGDFCPACDEALMDGAEAERYQAAVRQLIQQADAGNIESHGQHG